MITQFFPTKATQNQKRYLYGAMSNPWGINIQEFICRIKEILDYLEDFPLFGSNQVLPEDNLIELVEFALTRKWQKQLPAQGYESTRKDL